MYWTNIRRAPVFNTGIRGSRPPPAPPPSAAAVPPPPSSSVAAAVVTARNQSLAGGLRTFAGRNRRGSRVGGRVGPCAPMSPRSFPRPFSSIVGPVVCRIGRDDGGGTARTTDHEEEDRTCRGMRITTAMVVVGATLSTTPGLGRAPTAVRGVSEGGDNTKELRLKLKTRGFVLHLSERGVHGWCCWMDGSTHCRATPIDPVVPVPRGIARAPPVRYRSVAALHGAVSFVTCESRSC